MHHLLVASIVESVRRRVAQGDCPTEPAKSIETLEEAVLQLAIDRDQARSRASGELVSAVHKFAPDLATQLVERWQSATTATQQATDDFLLFLRTYQPRKPKDCINCRGAGRVGIPGAPCEFCDGTGVDLFEAEFADSESSADAQEKL